MAMWKRLLILITNIGWAIPFLASDTMAISSETDLAKRLYQRIAGIPGSSESISQMAGLIKNGSPDAAAFIAMEDARFYSLVLKGLFSPHSNRDSVVDLPLTDFTATLIGLVRDNERFDQILYGDVLYTSNDDTLTTAGMLTGSNAAPAAGKVRPPVRTANNTNTLLDNLHYSDLQALDNWPALLYKRKQSDVYALTSNYKVPASDIAGLISTRQAASEFFSAGTNRRAVKFFMQNFLICGDFSNMKDIGLSTTRIRKDVDRAPGGTSQEFESNCRGCHSGLDGVAGAFVSFDYSGTAPSYTTTINATQPAKMHRMDAVFPQGYAIVDNSWQNFWTQGNNASLGWRSDNGVNVSAGTGARDFGKALAGTMAFSECTAKQVFAQVCMRAPTPKETALLKDTARNFETGFSYTAASGPYNLKALFAAVSHFCFGGVQ